nr:ATP-binding cassette domain-containing protein [Pedobacter panaciterrae]
MIQLRNFKKSYGEYTALQIPELDLDTGIYWVKGVNGSGKSTLLKSMAGMLSCQGDILINTTSLKKNPVHYRKLVNFGEAEPLFPTFITGLEMIDLFVSAKDAPNEQKESLIESLKMQHYIQTAVNSYSSGMLKKLSLVLAFIGNPSVILLDEPLITIDTDSLKVLYHLIAKEHTDRGTTFLITSHQPLDPQYLPNTKQLLVEEQTLKACLNH